MQSYFSQIVLLHRQNWRQIGFLILVLAQNGCKPSPPPDPKVILAHVLQAHGSERLQRATVTFNFRGKAFSVTRNGGQYRYIRQYQDSTHQVKESLSNQGVEKWVNGTPQVLTDVDRAKIETALNSVVYFALLPFNLTDAAVQLRYLRETQIESEPYHEIEVTFKQAGGGLDYQDRYVYWFHTNRYTMDYFAYYYPTGEVGSRFRKALNPRVINGVRFADYFNFRHPDVLQMVEHYAPLIHDPKLEKVSEVLLTDLHVAIP